jgi:hypothetical protein
MHSGRDATHHRLERTTARVDFVTNLGSHLNARKGTQKNPAVPFQRGSRGRFRVQLRRAQPCALVGIGELGWGAGRGEVGTGLGFGVSALVRGPGTSLPLLRAPRRK